MTPFLSALRSGKVLLMDGAMGTELQRLTQSASLEGYEQFNLTHPDLVRSIHCAYRAAGARVFLANTFQTNPVVLLRHDLIHKHQAIWQAGLRLAREAAGEDGFVLADIGPIHHLTADIARALVREGRHADGMLLETWSSLDELKRFHEVLADEAISAPLLLSFTFRRDVDTRELLTFAGARPEECAGAAVAMGAVAVGANCGKEIGMRDMAELVKRYRSACDLPLFVRPNAGTPTPSEAGWIYPRAPLAMAEELPSILQAGAVMAGGCCGTTPDHIRAFRARIDSKQERLV